MPDPNSASGRAAVLDLLTTSVPGVSLPGDARYAALATPWNLAVHTVPMAVVDAADTDAIVRTIRVAGEHGVPVAVQSTGHGAADDLEGAILVVTRRMTECAIDPDASTARVGAGVEWQQVLEAAAPHGLAGLAGSAPGVSVAGYTTGGGIGPIARTYGPASRYVRAFEVVTGDAVVRRATATENPDLFWALRGGKGALGIVTAVEFDLLPIRELYAGALYFGGGAIETVLRAWASWCKTLPPEATTSIALLQLPPMPGVPEPLAGHPTIAVRFAWTGSLEAGPDLLAPIRAVAPTLVDAVGVMPYVALGMIHADPVDPVPGYERHGLLHSLPDGAVDELLRLAGPGSGSPLLVVEVRQLGGALAVRDDDGAFDGTDAAFNLAAIAINTPPTAQAVIAQAERLFAAMAPWLTGYDLPNFAPGSSAERFRQVFEPRVLDRLRTVAATYDPAGILLAGRGLRES